jgi:pimeloyl-ACP methyl ester carboxylesterase
VTPTKTSIEHTSATTPTRYAEAGGVKFAFRELGTPGGVPVVLLHHFTATIDDWDPRFLDGLAARRHVIYVDNRGVGGSSGKVPGRVQSMAADIMTFVNDRGHRQVDLLGFSLGGMVAQVIALEHPYLVRRLVLTGTGPAGFPGVGQPNRRLVADTLRALATLSDPKPLLFFTRTPSGKAAAVAYMERLAERTEDRVPATRAQGVVAQLAAIIRWGRQRPLDLEAIHQPTLVANGEDDRMLATRGSFELAHRIPNATLVIYPDAGHGGIFQHHDRFVPQVLEHLDVDAS